MKHIATILLAFLVTLSSPVAAQDFDKGLAAYEANDCKTALKEWKPLVKQRNSAAQYYFGAMYMNGFCLAEDEKAAIKFYTLAADNGSAEAQNNLATRYEHGWSVIQDYTQSLIYRKMAAEQGHEYAQYSLALMYYYGESGVIQNHILAHQWSNIAAANGHAYAVTFRKDIETAMTSEDISKAQAMARKCMNSNYKKCGY